MSTPPYEEKPHSSKRKMPLAAKEQPHASKKITPHSAEEHSYYKKLPINDHECQPVLDLSDLDDLIREPPVWVSKVESLIRRSVSVVKNIPHDCHINMDKYTVRKRYRAGTVPKTLVCYYCQEGHQPDRIIQLSDEKAIGKGYPFYYWAQIDIFTYFSKSFITIPPLCWINAGHKNGVKVLGTILTQEIQGTDMCDNGIFLTPEAMKDFAKKLAKLTKIFGFDGWLLKIDNLLENISTLKEFVTYFAHLLHTNNPENLLIWWDTIIETGEWAPQRELNENNRCFFDLCDGILLNFNWDNINLIRTAKTAQYRNLEVYAGIDVFNERLYRGGFQTHEAARLARNFDLSIAIFAPNWTYEKMAVHHGFPEFLNTDSAFWYSLWLYLYTYPICNYFDTNFNIGYDQIYYNIYNQQLQPSKCLHPFKIRDIPNFRDIRTLVNQCCCMRAAPLDSGKACGIMGITNAIHFLFACDIEIVDNIVVYFLTLKQNLPTIFSISLLTYINNSYRQIKLLGSQKEILLNNQTLLEVNKLEDGNLYEMIKSKYINMIENYNWILSVYEFNTLKCKLQEVAGMIEQGEAIYLGAFGIQNADAFRESG